MPPPELPSSDGHHAALMEIDPDPAPVVPGPGVKPVIPAPGAKPPTVVARRSADRTEQPDVLLDAVVSVKEIKLDVQGLKANVRVNAEVGNLVKLSVGADVSLDRVTLTITGVEVKALLEVRLDEVSAILDRALTLLIENPEILEVLGRTLVDVVHEVGEIVAPVVQGVINGVVAPVVQGVIGQVIAPVVDGVVRGLNPPPPDPSGGSPQPPVSGGPLPPLSGGPLPPLSGGPLPPLSGGPQPPAPARPAPPAPAPAEPKNPPPPAPASVGVARPPAGQSADKAPGPVTDHSGRLHPETLSEAGQAPLGAPAVAAPSDGALERAIRLLAMLDKEDK